MRKGRSGTVAGLSSAIALVLVPGWAIAQQPSPPPQGNQPMASVATGEARLTGGLEVGGGVARLVTNASVTAFDHAAPIALSRGGHVLVCSTSEFHLLRSGANGALTFGLDRGAIEIYSQSEPQDVVRTPDLKFTLLTQGPLDLRLRVTREGDTCVDNAGPQAPVLNATDAFSSASYRVLPGQHLLFVDGDLHKVVDREQSPCGCPTAFPPMIAGSAGQPAAAAAAAHPFPQAQSEGLAPPPPPSNEAPVGTASSQVSSTFSYDNGKGTPPPGTAEPAATAGTTTPPPAPEKGGFFHAIGRFLKKIFGAGK